MDEIDKILYLAVIVGVVFIAVILRTYFKKKDQLHTITAENYMKETGEKTYTAVFGWFFFCTVLAVIAFVFVMLLYIFRIRGLS